MNIVLLSGGSGKRLWPLSNNIRSKQFIKIFKGEDGSYESMVQRMYRQIKKADPSARILVATGKAQVSALHNQLGSDISVSVEPYRRDTFPAIVLAVAYMRDVMGVSEDDPVVVCPVDPLVGDDYFRALGDLGDLAVKIRDGLCLMGIEPAYPSEKYGYVIPEPFPCGQGQDVFRVREFKEKPDTSAAKGYISQGALWNSGVMACRIGYLLGKIDGFTDYQSYYDNYQSLDGISFDYAVIENETNIWVKRFNGDWKDLGTWNTLTEAMDEYAVGNAIIDETSTNTHILNELDIPVLAAGLHDVVIGASAEGILVSDKRQSSHIKKYVDQLEQPVMFADKSWGTYRVLDVSDGSMTIKVSLDAESHMNYHSHEHRDEVWTVISGKGIAIVDGIQQEIGVGDVVSMPVGCKHTVTAVTKLEMIEVQLGEDISVNDKIKHEYIL